MFKSPLFCATPLIGATRYAGMLVCSLALGLTAPNAESLEIVRDGKPKSQIVVADNALPQVRFAAKELQHHLQKMSGATLPIVAKPDDKVPHSIYVGESDATRALGLNTDGLPMEGYKVIATGQYLALLGRDGTVLPIPRGHTSVKERPRLLAEWQALTGEKWDMPRNGIYDPRYKNEELDFSLYDPTGTLFAVYDLLETMGVRWYLPYYDFGTIIPDAKTVDVPEQDRSVTPVFSYRFMRWSFPSSDLDGFLWAKRMKIGMAQVIWLDHGTSSITRLMDDSHPELFAVVGGRLRDHGGKTIIDRKDRKQWHALPRLAKPMEDAQSRYADIFFKEFPEMSVFPVAPSDAFTSIDDRDVAAGWLREERGTAGRLSDYVWTYVDGLAKRIGEKHPDKIVLGLAYSYYRLPPADIEKMQPNVAVAYCQTRNLLMLDPKERAAIFKEREVWFSKLPSGIFYQWEYNLSAHGKNEFKFDGQLRGVPMFTPTILQEDLKALAGKSTGEFVECAWDKDGKMMNPGLNHLSYYLQARLYWTPDADVEALIQEYSRLFYGPAAAEMREFYQFAEQVWTRPLSRQITLTGGFMRPADVDRYFEILDRASAKVPAGSDYAKRIEVIRTEASPMKLIFERLKRQGPDVAVAKTGERPTIDGDLTKPFWTQGGQVFPMKMIKDGAPPEVATHVQFRWADDNSGLYIAIEAMEPDMARLKPQAEGALRDSLSIYDTDFVEILLETATHSTFRFVTNPDGVIFDDCSDSAVVSNPIEWTAGWKLATRRGEDRWTVEIFVPRESLAQAAIPTRKESWGINVCRSRLLGGNSQNSAISPTGGRFFRTEKFCNLFPADQL